VRGSPRRRDNPHPHEILLNKGFYDLVVVAHRIIAIRPVKKTIHRMKEHAECLVFILNTRRRIKGHYLASIGTMDTILCHPREVFRLAIMASASGIIICHNHPSGESTPSEADIKVTRDLIRAGQLLKI
jgi:DNA repair protein RadC